MNQLVTNVHDRSTPAKKLEQYVNKIPLTLPKMTSVQPPFIILQDNLLQYLDNRPQRKHWSPLPLLCACYIHCNSLHLQKDKQGLRLGLFTQWISDDACIYVTFPLAFSRIFSAN